VKKQWAQTG